MCEPNISLGGYNIVSCLQNRGRVKFGGLIRWTAFHPPFGHYQHMLRRHRIDGKSAHLVKTVSFSLVPSSNGVLEEEASVKSCGSKPGIPWLGHAEAYLDVLVSQKITG